MSCAIVRGVAVVGSLVLAAGVFVRPAIAQTGLPSDAPFTVATFFGGSGGDYARAVATDADGYVYVAGDTESTDFPWTAKLYTGPTMSRLAFVLKLTPDGSRVVYATLIGPAVVYDVAVDATGHAYVAGETYASDFPAVNALQPACVSCDRGYHSLPDAIVAKLDLSGAALVYSTYLGSDGYDRATAIAVDSAGRAVVVGQAEVGRGSDFPVVNTPAWSQVAEGPWRPTGFVAVFSAGGSTLDRVARLHASIGDVAVDANDRIHLTGGAVAAPGIPLVRPTQTFAAGSDAFAMRLAPDGASLEFSTIVGGNGSEVGRAIAVAAGGDILVAGLTSSDDLATPGAFQTMLRGREDGFVARLDPETPAVRYVTYLGGGTWQDYVFGLAVDASGRAYVVGATSSVDFPTMPPPADVTRQTTVFTSTDGGQVFQGAVIPGVKPLVSCFASVPRPFPSWGPRAYGCTYLGLLHSIDNGRSWWLDSGTVVGGGVRAVAIDPLAPEVVYAVAVSGPSTQLFKSTQFGDGGWVALPVPTLYDIDHLATDPFESGTLYVVTPFAVLRSTDGGSTWHHIDAGLSEALAGSSLVRLTVHPSEPGRLYLSIGARLFTSASRGNSWYPIDAGLDASGILGIAVAPAAPSNMFVLTYEALYHRANASSLWVAVQPNGFTLGARTLAVSAADASVVWLGGLEGLFRSDDAGRTFTRVASIPDEVSVTALAVNAAEPNVVSAGVGLRQGQAFFSILSPLGDGLEFGVRLGGRAGAAFTGLTTAPAGRAWIVGQANAPGLPTAGAMTQVPRPDGDVYIARFDGTADHDDDGLPTWWEIRTGLDPHVPNADDDDDGDGWTNAEEFERGTHPRGFVQAYLAEGVTGSFFETRVNLVNPRETETASVQLRFLTDAGETVSEWLKVPPRTRRAVTLNQVPGLANAAVSTTIESDELVAVDRTVTWDGTGYGAHAGQAVEAPATAWYFAEGATTPGFELYYLVENPNTAPADVTFTWLPADGRGEVVHAYQVPPLARLTILANAVPGLEHAEIALVVTTDEATPVVVERAMYRHASGQVYAAGHGGAGVTAAATTWYLAEGATGPFFDLFVLVANPSFADAPLEVRYLLPDGRVIVRSHVVPARQRLTIWVDLEDPTLADTAVSTTVTSVNGVPIVVERAMWWPGPTYHSWYGAHVAAGATATAAAWALADGEAGGGLSETYVLLGNPGAIGGDVRVTLVFDDGSTAEQTVWLAPQARTTVNVLYDPWTFSSGSVPARLTTGAYFGVLVEALDPELELVVESAVYGNAAGQPWASGRCTLATPLLSR